MGDRKNTERDRKAEETFRDREHSGIIRAAAMGVLDEDPFLPTADGWDPVRPRQQKAG